MYGTFRQSSGSRKDANLILFELLPTLTFLPLTFTLVYGKALASAVQQRENLKCNG
jgi:hypothetical protein